MKIPISFLSDEQIFSVRCLIKVPHYHISFGNVSFIIDTGSASSFISETDANRIKIPINKLEEDKSKFGKGLAGGAIRLYKLTNIIISFLEPKTNQIQKIHCNRFYVGKSASPKPELRIVDSILGNDFLIEHKLKFIANPYGESYLESIKNE